MTVYAAGFFLLFGFSCAYNMTPPLAGEMALAPLRPRPSSSDNRYYSALLSQAYLAFWTIALSATVWTGALGGATLKLFLPGRFDRASIALTWCSAGRR